MTALQTLNTISKSMATTQSRISTGLRVADASDNAAYWSISTSMKSDNGALSSVEDALGLGAGKLDTAYTGITEVIDTVDKIKQKLVTARGASQEDQQKIQTEINTLVDHIKSTVANSNYAGSNILEGNAVTIISSYNRDGTTVTPDTISLAEDAVNVLTETNMAVIVADDWFDASSGEIEATDVDTMLGAVEGALSSLTDNAATIGAAKSRVDLQKDFVSKLSDAIERGVGQLVDADMNEESARLSALQVQQQLGIQALSIANSNSQNILALFR